MMNSYKDQKLSIRNLSSRVIAQTKIYDKNMTNMTQQIRKNKKK